MAAVRRQPKNVLDDADDRLQVLFHAGPASRRRLRGPSGGPPVDRCPTTRIGVVGLTGRTVGRSGTDPDLTGLKGDLR